MTKPKPKATPEDAVPPNSPAMMKMMLEACGDAIEENMPDCGFIVILATTGEASPPGNMRYLSNLTRESRDDLFRAILLGEEDPKTPSRH